MSTYHIISPFIQSTCYEDESNVKVTNFLYCSVKPFDHLVNLIYQECNKESLDMLNSFRNLLRSCSIQRGTNLYEAKSIFGILKIYLLHNDYNVSVEHNNNNHPCQASFFFFLVWPRLCFIGQFPLRGMQIAPLKLIFYR
jgi:hypothetical protein